MLVTGSLMAIGGGVFGTDNFLNWTGKNVVLEQPLTPGTPVRHTFQAAGTRRYAVGIQISAPRASLPLDGDRPVMTAKMPLVVAVTDEAGQRVASAVGWLDPSEPPTTVDAPTATDGRSGRGPSSDVVAERSVDPFTAPASQRMTVDIDLGADRLGTTKLSGARLVVYDDALPSGVVRPLVAAGVGALVALVGLLLAVVRYVKRSLALRRSGIRAAHDV